MHELMVGWQWLGELPFTKAIFEALAEMLHGSWICGGDPLRHSVEDCKNIIEHYAPYSLIVLAVVFVFILADKLGSQRH